MFSRVIDSVTAGSNADVTHGGMCSSSSLSSSSSEEPLQLQEQERKQLKLVGGTEGARNRAVFDRAVGVVRSLGTVPDDAVVLHDRLETAFGEADFVVEREVPATLPSGATGRIDLMVEQDGQRVVLELDGRSPRARSLHKLLQFPRAWRIAVLRGGSTRVAVPSGIDAVVSVRVQSYSFERFWNAYPKRIAKSAARIAWDRIKPNEALVEKILAAIEFQRSKPQWQREGGQYIPYPATWLHRHQWEDDIGPIVPPTPPMPPPGVLKPQPGSKYRFLQ